MKGAKLLEEDLHRMQRASWVLRQRDTLRTLGTKENPVSREDCLAIIKQKGEEDTYEIVHIGDNFVLGDRCDDYGEWRENIGLFVDT